MELLYPLYRPVEEDIAVTVAGLDTRPVTGEKGHGPVAADTTVDDVTEADYDALVIPGGFAPDKLRRSQTVLDLERACRRSATTWRTPGPTGIDEPTVVDGNRISTRTAADLGP